MKEYFSNGLDVSEDDLYDLQETINWHILTEWEEPLEQVKCNICGGTTFNVAQIDYWTGIKCPTCGWETCIHSG